MPKRKGKALPIPGNPSTKRPTESLVLVAGTILNVLVQAGVLDATQRSYVDNWLGWALQGVGALAPVWTKVVEWYRKRPS